MWMLLMKMKHFFDVSYHRIKVLLKWDGVFNRNKSINFNQFTDKSISVQQKLHDAEEYLIGTQRSLRKDWGQETWLCREGQVEIKPYVHSVGKTCEVSTFTLKKLQMISYRVW